MKKSHASTKHPKMKRHMMAEDSKDGMKNMMAAQGRTKPAPKPLMNQMGPALQMPPDMQMTSAKNKAQKEKPVGMVKKIIGERGQGNAQANQSTPKGMKHHGMPKHSGAKMHHKKGAKK